jgi:hypothetical protein
MQPEGLLQMGGMPDAWDCAALTGLDRGGAAKPGALPRAYLRRPFRPGIASSSCFENLAGLSGLELRWLCVRTPMICAAGLVFALKGRWIIAPASGRGFGDLPSECSLKGCCKCLRSINISHQNQPDIFLTGLKIQF